MGYSDLIDRLLDTRIDEGMISSIGKNKEKNKDVDIDSLRKALMSGGLYYITSKYLDIHTSYFNNSPFSNKMLFYIVGKEKISSQGGKDYTLYHLVKDKVHYFMITITAVDRTYTRMKRCIIQRCNNDEIAEAIWDVRASMYLMSDDIEFKGCKIVADTYWASGNAIRGSYVSNSIINGTNDIIIAMFNDAVNCMRSLFGSGYENFISRLVDNCSMYLIRLDGTTLSMYFEFDDEDMCSTLHGELKKGLGSISTGFYNIFKRSNTEIGIEFFF